MQASLLDKSITWWITAILTPIGVIGGPLAIADIFSGLITWHGPIGYLVAFWDVNVSQRFKTIANYITSALSVPQIPDLAIDYIALGLLFAASFIRGVKLAEAPTSADKTPLHENILLVLGVILAWPLYLHNSIVATILLSRRRKEPYFPPKSSESEMAFFQEHYRSLDLQTTQMRVAFTVTLAPFLIFLVLWAINAAYQPQPPT